KLRVNEPGDACEQEADRVAEQMMRMAALDVAPASAPPQLSRKCATCEAGEEQEKLQRKEAGAPEAIVHEAPASVHEVLRSPGEPLDSATRAYFEPRLGYDFSRVRVHTDAAANESANDVRANAYAVGHHIVFGVGRFDFNAMEGRRLLAHELTHVVQQSAED